MGVKISPSILSADFTRLREEIRAVEEAGADFIHVDVMDGHFVDNLTIGPPVVAAVKKVTSLPLDVHLMIETPEKSFKQYLKAGADYLTFHVEAAADPRPILEEVRAYGVKSGITMRPGTDIEAVVPFLEFADLVLVMSVNPGWSGQTFMHDQLKKIKLLKEWAAENNPELVIEVDGGINVETAKLSCAAGAGVLVAGNAVFKTADYRAAIAALRGT